MFCSVLTIKSANSVIGFAVSSDACNREIITWFSLSSAVRSSLDLLSACLNFPLSCGRVFCLLDISVLLSVSGTCVRSHRQPAGCSRIYNRQLCRVHNREGSNGVRPTACHSSLPQNFIVFTEV